VPEGQQPGTGLPDVYQAYETAVSSLYGGDSDSKRLAQQLTENLPSALSDPDFASTLFECFSRKQWQSPSSTARSNWIWRSTITEYSESRAEVRLERKIVEAAGADTWSFQMSTMSGIFGDGSHQRRAIDLVHKAGPNEYAFIELKIGSNNPVFAAFEILGYGLAYCQARRHADVHSTPSTHDVLRARKIQLIVLAPFDWYCFHARGQANQLFNLEPLEAALNAGLEHLRLVLSLPGLDALTFEFRQFTTEPELLRQVACGELGGASLHC
jgi:hypothetical protein